MRGARGDAARRAEAAQTTTSQSAFGDYVKFDDMFGASCIFTTGDPEQVQRQREAYVQQTMARKLYGYVHRLETHGAPIQRVVVGGGCEAAENRGGFPTSRPRDETAGALPADALANDDPLASRKRARRGQQQRWRTRGGGLASRARRVAPQWGARALDGPGARLGADGSLANLFEQSLGEDWEPGPAVGGDGDGLALAGPWAPGGRAPGRSLQRAAARRAEQGRRDGGGSRAARASSSSRYASGFPTPPATPRRPLPFPPATIDRESEDPRCRGIAKGVLASKTPARTEVPNRAVFPVFFRANAFSVTENCRKLREVYRTNVEKAQNAAGGCFFVSLATRLADRSRLDRRKADRLPIAHDHDRNACTRWNTPWRPNAPRSARTPPPARADRAAATSPTRLSARATFPNPGRGRAAASATTSSSSPPRRTCPTRSFRGNGAREEGSGRSSGDASDKSGGGSASAGRVRSRRRRCTRAARRAARGRGATSGAPRTRGRK